MIKLKSGIRFGDHFAVDPTVKSELAVISHAHSDHLRSHPKLIGTEPTIDFARLQYKKFESVVLDYGQEYEIGPARIELASAGHVLGSAQVIIDWRGDRVVYTGDFKLEQNLTCPPAEIHPCDVLFIDATYGKPRYRFPALEECRQLLLEFAKKQLDAGVTPIVLAYSIGKAQEAMKMLGDEGFEMEVHNKAYDIAQVYIKHGVDIKNISVFEARPTPGKVVILPPGFLKYAPTYGWGRFKTCFLSGWTLDREYMNPNGSGYGIPFSDHASFDDIIKYIEKAKPKQIYTLFGPPDIAEYLRRLGFKAEAADFNSGHQIAGKDSLNLDLF